MSTLGTPYAEKVGSEGPSGLQTKVNITRVHKRAAKEADNDGPDTRDIVLLFRQVIPWHEGILIEHDLVIIDLERAFFGLLV